MEKKQRSGVWALLLLLLFGALALMVLLLGARAYQTLVERDEAAFDERTCLSYVAARFRHGEGSFVSSFSDPDDPGADGISTLYLPQTAEGKTYYIRIYYYDGAVRELYAAADSGLSPQDGSAVLSAQSLVFSQEDGLLSAETVDSRGQTARLVLYQRGGGGQ